MLNFFKKIQPLVVWGISDIYFILAVTITIIYGVLATDLQNQLTLSNSQLGFMGFAFFISFGVTQLLTGSLLDAWGPKTTLTLSACVTAIGLFLLSQAQSFNQALIAQFIIGIGLSTAYVGAIYLAALWFTQKTFSLMAGITLMSANIISASLISILAIVGAVTINFRTVMTAFAIASLVVAFFILLIVRKPPHMVEEACRKSNFWEDLSHLLHIPQFWLGTIFFSTTIGVYLSFSSLWNVPDSIAYGHDLKTATMMSATLRYGTALGSFLAGWFASYLSRKSILAKIYSSGALLLGMILIYRTSYPISVEFFLFALFGFFLGGVALGFPLVGQHIPEERKGTGFGLMASIGYLICAFLEYITGVLLSYQIPSDALPGIDEFKIALTPLVLMLALGWLCTFALKDVSTNST